MPITIDGSGTVTGISAGGLPDDCIVTADIADANITAAKLNGAQTGSAPIYGCRAWVNFDGTRNESDTGASTNGANVKIRASGNVASVLKNATGDYTITFTTAMADANYAVAAASGRSATATRSGGLIMHRNFAVGSFNFQTSDTGNNAIDHEQVTLAIFR